LKELETLLVTSHGKGTDEQSLSSLNETGGKLFASKRVLQSEWFLSLAERHKERTK
jgi:hypothetical protein